MYTFFSKKITAFLCLIILEGALALLHLGPISNCEITKKKHKDCKKFACLQYESPKQEESP